MHVKFPSIHAFRNTVFHVQRAFPEGQRPVLTFRGTPKLHGTNAGIVYCVGKDTLSYQSRDRQLSLGDDLFGFMGHMSQRETVVEAMMLQFIDVAILKGYGAPDYVAAFGEWAGGSIQKTDIAVRSMEKFWAIVGVRLYYGDLETPDTPVHTLWLDIEELKNIHYHGNRIFNICEFGVLQAEIDFNEPSDADIEIVTQQVEDECPIGEYFGRRGHGEGTVWECTTPGFTPNDWSAKYPESSSFDLSFKSKGEKHEVSKKKEMTPVDPVYQEAVRKFVIYSVTENRMQQGLDKLTREVNQPMTPKILGAFIKWVHTDVLKEESDVMIQNGIAEKDLGAPLADKAKTWFFKKLQEQA